jgi:YD repeat-containing protein
VVWIDTLTFVTTWTYNAQDAVTSLTYPDGEVVRTDYNVQGAPARLRSDQYGDYVSDVAYTASGQVERLDLGNTLTTDYEYDPLSARLHRVNTGGLLDLTYGYDATGNVRTIHDASRDETLRYDYDNRDRLTHFETSDTAMKTVTVRAKGSAAEGWPLMQLWVNGILMEEWTVDTSSYANYTANVPLTGQDQIAVAFTNDHGTPQGDIYVDRFVVDGQTIQAEDSSIRYDRGKGTLAFDGLDVIDGPLSGGAVVMAWNGALHVDVASGGDWLTEGTYAYDAIGNLTAKNGLNYTYDPQHVHAVAAAGDNTYVYDANGNMIQRLINGSTYTLVYNAENRLEEVRQDGQTIVHYTYDGDGALVKAERPQATTYYVGKIFEVEVDHSTQPQAQPPDGETIAEAPTPEDEPSGMPTRALPPLPEMPSMIDEPAYTAGKSNTVYWTMEGGGYIWGVSSPESKVGEVGDPALLQTERSGDIQSTRYRVRRATNSACTVNTVESPLLYGTSYTFSGLQHNVRYYSCVKLEGGSYSIPTHSTQDAVAPQAAMNALPTEQQEPAFTVSWHGSDNGSGIHRYRVQYSVDGGNWKNWKYTSGTSATFTGAYDHIYRFRVRVQDRAGNYSNWSEPVSTRVLPDPVTITKYYYLGSRRVALRTDGDLTYLHADHLGSASLATDANGVTLQNSNVRYLPFGGQRVAGAGMPTDRLYPGRGLRPTSRARDRPALGRGDRPV